MGCYIFDEYELLTWKEHFDLTGKMPKELNSKRVVRKTPTGRKMQYFPCAPPDRPRPRCHLYTDEFSRAIQAKISDAVTSPFEAHCDLVSIAVASKVFES